MHLLGHDVTACTTAKVALDHCRQQFFPLIIFDIPLSDMTPENFCRPSVDPMLRSVVAAYGDKVLTVILTGM